MDMRTGEIMDLEEMRRRIAEKPELAKVIKEVPAPLMPYISEVQNMNRKDKRAWLRKNKHLFK